MTTRPQALRYASSSARNVANFISRLNGVNKGGADTRKAELDRLLSPGFELTLENVKKMVGVRQSDSGADASLTVVVSQVQAIKEKAQKNAKAEKAETAAKDADAKKPVDLAPSQADNPAEAPTKPRFKKGKGRPPQSH